MKTLFAALLCAATLASARAGTALTKTADGAPALPVADRFVKGRVHHGAKVIGDVSMTQLAFGAQRGGEGFNQISFFEDEAALKKFTQGEVEFGVQAQAVVTTQVAGAQGGTVGGTVGASVTKHKAKVVGAYNNGLRIFTAMPWQPHPSAERDLGRGRIAATVWPSQFNASILDRLSRVAHWWLR